MQFDLLLTLLLTWRQIVLPLYFRIFQGKIPSFRDSKAFFWSRPSRQDGNSSSDDNVNIRHTPENLHRCAVDMLYGGDRALPGCDSNDHIYPAPLYGLRFGMNTPPLAVASFAGIKFRA
jgi:hypothetical protein